jgi:hypothetical protein
VDGRSRVTGQHLGGVGVGLHPHDLAIADGEDVSDHHVPRCAVGETAIHTVDDDDVISSPVRPPRSPNAPGWPIPGRPEHRAPKSKDP